MPAVDRALPCASAARTPRPRGRLLNRPVGLLTPGAREVARIDGIVAAVGDQLHHHCLGALIVTGERQPDPVGLVQRLIDGAPEIDAVALSDDAELKTERAEPLVGIRDFFCYGGPP